MAYTGITAVNDRASGGILVSAEWNGELSQGIDRFELRRYVTGEETWTVVYEGQVSEPTDLSWQFLDIWPKAGVSYTYEACAIAGTTAVSILDAVVVCRFEGVVLADGNGRWHSAFGTSENRFALSAQKNRPVSYIITLSGKYPHRVSNSQANYWTGNTSAIWLPWAERRDVDDNIVCVEPSFEDADRYRLDFIEWLMSDTEKLMKTEDGKAMMVSIDGSPQEGYSPIAGMTTVSFDWTQTGEPSGVFE